MNLATYITSLRDQLVAAADSGGPDSRAAVERLAPGLEAAVRLTLLEALSAAADEITRELAPGAVEIRLRGSDPDFVVVLPDYAAGDAAPSGRAAASPTGIPAGDDEGGTGAAQPAAPGGAQDEDRRRGAAHEGLSLNAWLVRAAAAAVEGTGRRRHGAARPSSQTFTGWVQ